ncbi:MAG: DUF3526 domain-containing protein [Thermoflexibacteraceae bacterium]
MLLHIAKKEFISLLRMRSFQFAAVLTAVLLLFALLISWHYYQTVAQELQTAQQLSRQQWETQEAKNPHSAAHFGTFAFKPTQPLSLLDNGLDKHLGVSVFLEAHKQNTAEYKQIADQNDLARFAELTPAFVLIYLFPLFIILLSFNIFTTEKEQDTLRLLLSQGISYWQLCKGKIMGVWGVLALLLVPMMAVSIICLLAAGATSEDYLRYSLFVMALLIYYAVFVNISVGVSAKLQSSNVALVGLLGFWVVATLLIPKLVANYAKLIYPTPSAVEYQQQLKDDLAKGVDGHDPFAKKSELFQDSVLKVHNVDSLHQLPFNYWGLVMQAGEEHETKVYARAVQRLYAIYHQQLQLYALSGGLSPTILLKLLSIQLAKTDLVAYQNFTQQAENYRIQLVRELNYDIKDNSKYNDWDYISKDKDFFKKNAKFSYKAPTMNNTWQHITPSLALLLLWFLGSIGGVFWSCYRKTSFYTKS